MERDSDEGSSSNRNNNNSGREEEEEENVEETANDKETTTTGQEDQQQQQLQQQQQQQGDGYDELKKEVKRAAKDVIRTGQNEEEGGGRRSAAPSSILPSKTGLQAPVGSRRRDEARKGQVLAATATPRAVSAKVAAAAGETKQTRTSTPPKVPLDSSRSPGEAVRERTLGQRRQRRAAAAASRSGGEDDEDDMAAPAQSATPSTESRRSVVESRRAVGRRRSRRAAKGSSTNKFGVGTGLRGSDETGSGEDSLMGSSSVLQVVAAARDDEEEGDEDEEEEDEEEEDAQGVDPEVASSIAEADATPVTDAHMQVVPVENAPYFHTLPPSPAAEDAKRKRQNRRKRRIFGGILILLLMVASVTIVALAIRDGGGGGGGDSTNGTDSDNSSSSSNGSVGDDATPTASFAPTTVPSVSPSERPSVEPSMSPSRSFAPSSSPTVTAEPTEEPFCTLCANGEPTPSPENASPILANCGAWEDFLLSRKKELNLSCWANQFDAYFDCDCPTFPDHACSWCGRDPRTGRDIVPINIESDEIVDNVRTCKVALKNTIQRYSKGDDQCLEETAKYASLCPCDETTEDAIRRVLYDISGFDVYDSSTVQGETADWVIADGRYTPSNSTETEKVQQLYALVLLSKVLDFEEGVYGTETDECSWTGIECNSEGMVVSFVQIGSQLPFGAKAEAMPDELVALRHLEVLEIHGQDFLKGPLPAATLGKLGKLRDLRVTDSQGLSGTPLPFTIFDELTNLEMVQFVNNGLTGTFPKNSWKLPNLHTLWFEGNRLSGTVPKQLSRAENLTVLALFDNGALNGTIPNALCLMATDEAVVCPLEIFVDCDTDGTKTAIACSQECCACQDKFNQTSPSKTCL